MNWQSMTRHNLFWPIIALVALLAANAISTPGFLSITIRDGHLFGGPIDILRNGAPLLLVSVGLTLVIATRGIDLSVGAVLAIAGALATSRIAAAPDPDSVGTVLGAVGITLAVCAVLGAFNGMLVTTMGIQPIIATLILFTAGRGVAMLITGGAITTINSQPYRWIGGGHLLGIPVPTVIAGSLLVLMIVVTRRTALGMMLESVGINPSASRLAGVKAGAIIFTAYVICSLFSGIAGLIESSTVMAADANNAGLFIELDAILAVVIGGTSLMGGKYSLGGTLVGVLIIATLEITVTILGIPPAVTPLFKAIVVIVVTLLQSPVLRQRLRARIATARTRLAEEGAA